MSYGGITVCKPYFQCGSWLPLRPLTVKCFNIRKKAPNQFVANVYTYLAVLEVLVVTNYYIINQFDEVSLFSISITNNTYFQMIWRRVCHTFVHYIANLTILITTIQVWGWIEFGELSFTNVKLYNTWISSSIFSFSFFFVLTLDILVTITIDGPPKGSKLTKNIKKIIEFAEKSPPRKEIS